MSLGRPSHEQSRILEEEPDAESPPVAVEEAAEEEEDEAPPDSLPFPLPPGAPLPAAVLPLLLLPVPLSHLFASRPSSPSPSSCIGRSFPAARRTTMRSVCGPILCASTSSPRVAKDTTSAPDHFSSPPPLPPYAGRIAPPPPPPLLPRTTAEVDDANAVDRADTAAACASRSARSAFARCSAACFLDAYSAAARLA